METPSFLNTPSDIGKTIFKNTAIISIGGYVLKGLSFLFNIFVIRRLGDSQFGQYSIVLGFVGIASIFAEFGLTHFSMREMARDRSNIRKYLGNLITLRLLLAFLGIFLITAAGKLFGYSDTIVLGIFIYTITFLFSAVLQPIISLLTAESRFDYVTTINFLGRVLFMVFSVVVLLGGGGFIWLLASALLPLPFQIGLAFILIRRMDWKLLEIEIAPRLWGQMIKLSLPFGINTLMLTIAFGIDTVILSKFEPDYVVGWYNVAYSLVFSIVFLFRGFKEAIVPSLTRAFETDHEVVRFWFYRSVRVILMFSTPIAFGGAILAFPLIRFLYSEEFLPSAIALQILIWDVPFLMFSAFCGNISIIIREERSAAKIYTINTTANVLLNLYAIPRYGLVGAAIVTVATDVIGAIQFYLLLSRKLDLPSLRRIGIKVLIASGGMGLIVWWMRSKHVLFVILLGAVAYLITSLVLRVFDEEEREFARKAFKRLKLLSPPDRLDS
jgi:O-antigen/teichoic acid export membrane protein